MLDIYQLLIREHANLRRLLGDLGCASTDLENRRRLMSALSRELDAHTAAEEQTLYAELLALSQDHLLAGHCVDEHDQANRLIAELCSTPLDRQWAAKLDDLSKILHHHLQAEEVKVFRRSRHLIQRDRTIALARRYRTLKRLHQNSWGEPPLADPLP